MARSNSIEQFNTVIKEIRSNAVKPVYFFTGDEIFFHDRLQEEFQNLIPEGMRDFNMDVLRGNDISVERLISIVKSYPMMAERRLVIIRDALSMDGNDGGSLNDLIPYLKSPTASTILVMIDPQKPNRATKFGKAVSKTKHSTYVAFDTVPEYKLAEWIVSWAKTNYKLQVDRQAAELLAQFVGDDLLQLSNEIEKLSNFDNTKSTVVGVDAIRKIVGNTREYTIFELKDAILARNRKQAMHIAEHMLQQSDSNVGEIIKSLGYLTSLYTQIWQIQMMLQNRTRDDVIKKKLGIRSDFHLKHLKSDAGAYRHETLPRVFEVLLDADKAVKGFTTMDHDSIFLLTIQKLMSLK